MSSLQLTVRRDTYSNFCRIAVKFGAADVHILSSTDTEYEVKVEGGPDAIDRLRTSLMGNGK